jgi:hypothetical protein
MQEKLLSVFAAEKSLWEEGDGKGGNVDQCHDLDHERWHKKMQHSQKNGVA